MMVDGKQQARRWACKKYGDEGAFKLALAQRLEWERKAVKDGLISKKHKMPEELKAAEANKKDGRSKKRAAAGKSASMKNAKKTVSRKVSKSQPVVKPQQKKRSAGGKSKK